MRAILLAAGMGTRISRYLSGRPKCTVDIGGIPLIEYTIQMMHRKGITDIAIVLGYNGQAIRDILRGYDVTFYENPFYDVTNSIASMWFARDFLEVEDRYLIMNGDVFLQDELLDRILEDELSPVMFADGSRREEADYKFKYEDGKLRKYGKQLTGDDITGEYIGLGCFDYSFMQVFVRQMNGMISRQQHNVWWENVVYEISENSDVYISDIQGLFWAEVDYIEDYKRILEFRGVSDE